MLKNSWPISKVTCTRLDLRLYQSWVMDVWHLHEIILEGLKAQRDLECRHIQEAIGGNEVAFPNVPVSAEIASWHYKMSRHSPPFWIASNQFWSRWEKALSLASAPRCHSFSASFCSYARGPRRAAAPRKDTPWRR